MGSTTLARRASEGNGRRTPSPPFPSLARRASVFVAGVLMFHFAATLSHAADSALDLFRQRITPILQAKNPSSCSECHLSGVDLKDYIGKTQEETFASLRDAGLVDVKKPAESKLLAFIAR